MGGVGNRCFQWAHAKSFCEQNNHELRCEEWVGEQIFTLDGYVPIRPDGTEQIQLFGYFQRQEDLIYSRADCRRWFNLRPEVYAETIRIQPLMPHVHLRRGDYASAGYPLISEKAAEAALAEHGFGDEAYVIVSDEGQNPELRIVHDFVRLMRAPVLFRANSTFSFWAGVLSHGRIFAPIITGLKGGVEHDDVKYVEGNWPACAELPVVTDLHLREE
jgi:hypothetical protein